MNDQLTTLEASIPEPLRAALRGIGQVFFQENAISGVCFLLGVALGSPLMALGGAIGVAIGTATARFASFKVDEISAGLYGFNATLVGMATFFFFQPGLVSIGLLVVGCVVATFLARLMRQLIPFPTYTTPFILVTWALFFLGPSLGATRVAVSAEPAVAVDSVRAVANGIGQVMFQAHVGTAVLFILGIALSDSRHAALVVLGSVLGMMAASYHMTPEQRGVDPEQLVTRFMPENIGLGLYGYNATLPAVALVLARRSLIAAILGALLSVPLTELVPKLGVPALTAPFVLASWLVLILGWLDDACLRAKAASDAGVHPQKSE